MMRLRPRLAAVPLRLPMMLDRNLQLLRLVVLLRLLTLQVPLMLRALVAARQCQQVPELQHRKMKG